MIWVFCFVYVSFLSVGAHLLIKPGAPFHFVGRWIGEQPKSIQWLLKPVIWCPVCMSSLWSAGFWLISYPLGWELLYLIPGTIIPVYGLNSFIWNQWYD